MEIVRSFKKAERSYDSTPDGWRLATCEEAKQGLEINMVQQHLKEWDRARLLDGWISGSGYGYEIRNEFRGCMGYMLLIQTQSSAENASGTPYADVNLSELGKEVALFLCVDDWNYEVVYWLLNSWSKSQTMKLSDVRGGNLPFVDAKEFKEMNKGIGRLARRLAEEEVAAREKGRTTQYSGTDPVEDVLTGMMQIVREEEQLTGYKMWDFQRYRGGNFFLPMSIEQMGDDAEVFWSFVCETFAGYVVQALSWENLKNIGSMRTKRSSKKNLMIATSILLYLSQYRSDIIHEPLDHECSDNCSVKFLPVVKKKAGGDRFSELRKHNAMWRCRDETGNYGVLSKLLFTVIYYKSRDSLSRDKFTAPAVDMLLKCGAKPEGCYKVHNYEENTTLHNAAKIRDKDVSKEVAQLLLERCDEESRSHFVNAVNKFEETALHFASEWGNAILCKLLVEFNASVIAQDHEGMTPLHYALEGKWRDEVRNVFMKNRQLGELVEKKDEKGNTPLDYAIANKDYASTAKLLSESKEPEDYLSKVDDQEQLLRYSLLVGSADVVEKLYERGIRLPAGNCDEDGKTALHLAAMRDDEDSATKIINIILSRIRPETPEQAVKMVAERDRRERTVLHEAALNGHEELCIFLLRKNPKILYMKDRNRRNPLYDLAKGKYNSIHLVFQWLTAFAKNDLSVDDLTDRSGLTPLHVAVSQGKAEIVHKFLLSDRFKEKYLSRGDSLGQTALHKAAKRGDVDMVKRLLEHGAHPLKERDCDGRTALHYAVQAETGDKKKLVDALFSRCESEEEKSLLLWASAAGLGAADKNLSNNDPLREFLRNEKKKKKDINLLRMAASVGDFEMTKQLIIKGYPIGDILIDSDWKQNLDQDRKDNVTRVSKLIDTIKEQGNDKPAILDTLGRVDYAQGIAALFLNPYTKPPIAVGITGTWGMGKSSLMLQTEQILLTVAAQMALLESSKLRSTDLELPNITDYKLSRKGEKKCENIYKHIMNGEIINRNLKKKEIQEELEKFLNKYDIKHRKVFKSLAAMDSSDMFQTNASRPKADPSAEENVPAVLTVQYNAWKYRNDTEALAGMAVEITKELEGVMTQAQWLSTCCRNTWRKKKYTLWIQIFFPSLLTLVLVGSLTWIIWVVFDSEKLKEWGKTKYAWPPAALIAIVWTVTKSIMGILKPVSTQLMQYISFPDHSDKLGYQETVISDITFLKEEITKKPYSVFIVFGWVFIVFGWVFTPFTVLWRLITESLLFHHRSLQKAKDAPKVTPASGSNLRIIVFVDDLDRCQESVILQVLSAINIVLAECEINVVMGMDKRLIQRAIMKKYGDGKASRSLKTSQELADMYLQKIIQLPLDLPDPSDEESIRFLKVQLGVYKHEAEAPAPAPAAADEETDDGESSTSGEQREAEQQNAAAQVNINVRPASEISETGSPNLSVAIQPTEERTSSRGDSENNCLRLLKFPVRNIVRDCIYGLRALWRPKLQTGIQQSPSSSILIREMLFVRYGQAEETAFLYFQGLATDSRKLPREWKRFLNYHRLVWYIFSLSEEAKTLAGWQVQLITWIFVCWEWQENINLVIEKWKEIKWKEINDLKTSESNEPSLLMIVEHLIEQHERENQKMIVTGKEEDGSKRTERLGEARGSVSKINDNEEIESSKMEQEKLNEKGKGKILEITEGEGSIARSTEIMEKDTSRKLVKEIDKLDALDKLFAEMKKEVKKIKEPASDDLKEEMKELIKQVSDELKEEIKELKKQMSHEFKGEMKELKKETDELKKEINEMRILMVKEQNGKKEQNMEKKKNKLHNLENWRRMKSTLERYDVSMDGIQAFQRFRFYCMSGYLPRPSLKEG